ncbi:hypothetical protein C8C77_1084 [Halanaerobium saccharolyticum]|uniref:Uncharacterized protein n=1 Tax=Halanaerobium saccharolyticum TaxID=43595 RepID=A0A4R7Z307_9FIRM|nr:hypothetical protein [Halanaerobium saccharolyticum]RAK10288.1 hypothetical protein C7958_10559 [Halanaerobium saccharolyticum]TDW05234.1 hypothetical protein C8C77_1084 [Halanaerobium saccharolyticum]TDX60304.1 hypothetical protein C7956_1094 [Halanaerobium saccharolyticum]
MFKEENNVETVLRLREMLVRAMMAENDVMQELVLSKLEELDLKRKDELKYAEKIIDSKSGDNAFKKLAQTAENGVKKAAGLASTGTRNVAKVTGVAASKVDRAALKAIEKSVIAANSTRLKSESVFSELKEAFMKGWNNA